MIIKSLPLTLGELLIGLSILDNLYVRSARNLAVDRSEQKKTPDPLTPPTLEELLVSSLARTDALAKLLIEKGLITREEFLQKIGEEGATYQKLLNPTRQ
jgi:hypothetical protein